MADSDLMNALLAAGSWNWPSADPPYLAGSNPRRERQAAARPLLRLDRDGDVRVEDGRIAAWARKGEGLRPSVSAAAGRSPAPMRSGGPAKESRGPRAMR